MAAWAQTARADAPVAAPLPRPRRARPIAQRRLAGGVVWIGLLAFLLTGVVALNVAVLRLNLELERLGNERVRLRAENAELTSKLSSAGTQRRVEAAARRAGLVVAPDPTYVDLTPGR